METPEQVFIAARAVGVSGPQEPDVSEHSSGSLLARAMGVQPPTVMLYADEGNRQIVMPSTSERWVFDRCFSAGTASSTQFLEDVAKQLVNNALCGFNTCLLSYGRYNMAEGAAEMDGLLRDFCRALFGTLGHPKEADSDWHLSMEAVEVHPHLGLHDLLAKAGDKRGSDLLLIRNNSGGWYVEGLCHRQLLTLRQLQGTLHDATVNRIFVDPAVGIGNALVYLRVSRAVYSTCRAALNDTPQRCVTSCLRPVILLVDIVGTVPAAVQPTAGHPHGTGPFENLSHTMQELTGPREAVTSPLSKLLLDFLGGNAKTLLLTHVQADFPADRNGVRKALNCAVNCGSILNTPLPIEDPSAAAIHSLLQELGDPPPTADPRRTVTMRLVAALHAVFEARGAAVALMKEREWAERKRRALAGTSSLPKVQALDQKLGQCRQQEMKWLLTLKEREEAVRECVKQRAAFTPIQAIPHPPSENLLEVLDLGRSPSTSRSSSPLNGTGQFVPPNNTAHPAEKPEPSLTTSATAAGPGAATASSSSSRPHAPPARDSVATSSATEMAPNSTGPVSACAPSPVASNPLLPTTQRSRRAAAPSPAPAAPPPPPPLPHLRPSPWGLQSCQQQRGCVPRRSVTGRSPRLRSRVEDAEIQTEGLLWVPADIHQEIRAQLEGMKSETLALHMQHAEVETQCTHMMSQLSLARGHLHATLSAKKEECRRLQLFAESLAQMSNNKKSRQDSLETLASKYHQLEGERAHLQRQNDITVQAHEQMRSHFIDFIRILKQDRRELYSLLREVRSHLSDLCLVPVPLTQNGIADADRKDSSPSPSLPLASSGQPSLGLPSVTLLHTIDTTLDRIASHTHVPFLNSSLFSALSTEFDISDRRSPSQGQSSPTHFSIPGCNTSPNGGAGQGVSPVHNPFTPLRRLSGSGSGEPSPLPRGGHQCDQHTSSSSSSIRPPTATTPHAASGCPPSLTMEQLEGMGYSADGIAQLKEDGPPLKFPELVIRFMQRFEQNKSPPPPHVASDVTAALSGSDSAEEESHRHHYDPTAAEEAAPGGLSVTAAVTAPDALHAPHNKSPKSPVAHPANGTGMWTHGREPPKAGSKAHFEQLLEMQLLSDKDDWVCILEVCDVVHKMNTARELLNALKDSIKRNGLFRRQMRALTILKYCVDNCGFYLFEDLASRKWLQRLVKVALSSQPEVRNYISRLLIAWNEGWATFMSKAQSVDFADAIKRLSSLK